MTLIALTPWRRTLSTGVHPENDLYTVDPQYLDSVEAAGAHTVVFPNSFDPDTAAERMRPFDGLVLTGGSDVDPALYGAEPDGAVGWNRAGDESDRALLHAALAQGKPVLAICRGLQLANVALGGTLHQHISDRSEHHRSRQTVDDESPEAHLAAADEHLARRHPVALTPGSLIAKLYDAATIDANSLHHQSADRIGRGLAVTGTTPDGIVEAIEHESGLLLAVQWHPERITDEGHHVLFEWLVDSA